MEWHDKHKRYLVQVRYIGDSWFVYVYVFVYRLPLQTCEGETKDEHV